MNNLAVSFIRTYVPLIVGSVLAWAATDYNVVVPEEWTAATIPFVTGVIVAAYYGIVHLLEQRWPFFGKFLGKEALPYYSAPAGE